MSLHVSIAERQKKEMVKKEQDSGQGSHFVGKNGLRAGTAVNRGLWGSFGILRFGRHFLRKRYSGRPFLVYDRSICKLR
jgi:hypothetical protein